MCRFGTPYNKDSNLDTGVKRTPTTTGIGCWMNKYEQSGKSMCSWEQNHHPMDTVISVSRTEAIFPVTCWKDDLTASASCDNLS